MTVGTHDSRWTPLHLAVDRGHEKVFELLVASCPRLIDAVTPGGNNALHIAGRGHANLVTRILVLRPHLIYATNSDGWSVLRFAVRDGHQEIAERLLAIEPRLIHDISNGRPILYHAIRYCTEQFVATLWQKFPQALLTSDKDERSPFDEAILFGKGGTNREIPMEFVPRRNHERVHAAQCTEKNGSTWVRAGNKAPLLLLLLLTSDWTRGHEKLFVCLDRDAVGTVLEYLGLERRSNDPLTKRRLHQKKKKHTPMGNLLCSEQMLLTKYTHTE